VLLCKVPDVFPPNLERLRYLTKRNTRLHKSPDSVLVDGDTPQRTHPDTRVQLNHNLLHARTKHEWPLVSTQLYKRKRSAALHAVESVYSDKSEPLLNKQNTPMNIELDKIKDLIEDPKLYPSSKGFRDAASPGFIFFDDDNDLTSDESWVRAEAVKFEEWLKEQPGYIEPSDQPKVDAHLSRIEELRKINWLIGWEKRKPANNDHIRKLIMPLIEHLDHPEHGAFCRAMIQAVKESVPFAPGPIKGTVFVNPDGTKHETAGVSLGTARAAYIKRHNLTSEHVSIERVQYENERTSKIVVGTRRTSDKTVSRYYDPNPQWVERIVDGEWVKTYQPSANNLYLVSESMTMPFGSHRLNVREFEQSIIAGAELFDDADESFAFQLEHNVSPDDRIRLMDSGKGCAGRTIEGMDEKEQYLYELLETSGHIQACELMSIIHQEPGVLASYFFHEDNPTTIEEVRWSYTPAASLIRRIMMEEGWSTEKVRVQSINPVNGQPQTREVDKYVQPEDSMVPYVFEAIMVNKISSDSESDKGYNPHRGFTEFEAANYGGVELEQVCIGGIVKLAAHTKW